MPCCCATNVKAALVLGIVLAVLSALVSCFNIEVSLGWLYIYLHRGQGALAIGMISALIHCILIFGAHTRNKTAILVWMILAILACIGVAIIAILGVVALGGVSALAGAHAGAAAAGQVAVFAIVFIAFMIGIILFQIWTIIVAKNARKEIDAGEYEFEIRIRNSSMHAFKG